LDATLLTVGEPGFPTPLAALDPPPPLIWTRGRSELLTRPAMAVASGLAARLD
jgi:DNA processing protein